MKQARLGRLDVARIGFGAMGMSAYYTGAREDDEQSIRTIHRAIDLGVTLIDTAEVYGPYLNEELVGRALTGRRDEVVLATKFGRSAIAARRTCSTSTWQTSRRSATWTVRPRTSAWPSRARCGASGRTASTFIISTASTRPPQSRRPPEPSVSSLTRARSCTTGSRKRRRSPSVGRMRYVR